ncbi:InlB B-repeat-containing protein [Paenibacillus sp. V4I7]|uniref:InlB B-repeat-containing protein n=1 Tax=Paenibacillus sp. V4I7 TaxID=3042307 RepID=UPI0027814309|nr:InlB B-repeat-containing protein [Paenibacillus sp. V4I7]MDQ0902045.1 putative repeat protein (TIGR02543 family) [Paenibacillus sp. V4I7]
MNLYWKKARIMMLAFIAVFVMGGITGLFVFGGSQAYAAATSKWEPVGGAGFSAGETWDPSLFVYNGTPYVAYIEGNNNTVTVKKYSGSSWEPIGSPISTSWATAGSTSLYVDNGIPYVAYRDGLNSDKITVQTYNGSNWAPVGSAGISANVADFTSLYVDNGTPYVAFKDYGNARKATVITYNGSSWEPVGIAGFSAGEIFSTSLKVDNGTPYVAFTDAANSSKATVMTYNGSGWEPVGNAGFSPGGAEYVSLDIHEGIPYVAYTDYSNGRKLSAQKYNGSNWEYVGSAGFSGYLAGYVTLKIDNGTPYVAFMDAQYSDKATVKKYNGSSWETVLNPGFSTGSAVDLSMDIHDSIPYVLYSDYENSSKATLMKLKFNVVYDGNGSTGGAVPTDGSSYDKNANATMLGNTGNLVKTGQTFAGWDTAPDGSGTPYAAGDTLNVGTTGVTLYARWTVNSYTVAYDGNGAASGTAPASSSHNYNTDVTVPGNTGNLARTGYTFAGWNTAANGSGTNYGAGGSFTMGAADVTLYARWTVNSYTVAYDSNGATSGSVPASGSHNYNTSVAVQGNTGGLVKTGHTFAGWTTALDGSGTDYVASDIFTIGTANVTLYAKWTVNSYSVSYDSNGAESGIAPGSSSHNYNTGFTLPGNTGSLEKTGHTFAGWNTAADGSGTNNTAGAAYTMGAANVTLYAKWTINSYTVAYDGNGSTGGSGPATGSHNYNTSVTVLGNIGSLEKTGHTFAGWNTAADGNGTDNAAEDTFTMGAAGVTLYAKWTINSYTVAYDGNSATSGSVPIGSSHVYNSGITLPDNSGSLEKTGHMFAGWNTAADGSGTDYAVGGAYTIGAANVTLYAKWTVNSYSVTYDGNDTTSGSAPTVSNHVYNTVVTVPGNIGNLEKTGYTFAGWNTAGDGKGTNYTTSDAFTIGAANVMLYAKWTINSYTVTYDGNGATSGSTPVASNHDYNTVVTVVTDTGSLEKTGHTFVGWNTEVDGSGTTYAGSDTFTIGADHVTLYAKWTVNSYTVAYDGNGATSGNVPAISSHDFNTGVAVLGNTGSLEKTGHTFAGWTTTADGSGTTYVESDTFTIGAANVTLYAKWTANSYTVSYNGNGSTSGITPADNSHDYNTGITVPGNIGSLEKTGHTFAGWNTEADGSGTNYTAADTFSIGAADVTLYAKWIVNSCTVSFVSNGGSPVSVQTATYGSTTTKPSDSTKTGYTFAGWFTDIDLSVEFSFTTAITGDTTLYAKWTINSYTVSYDSNGSTGGGTPTGGSHDYNTSVTVLGNTGSLVKTGHTFEGWNATADGSGTNYTALDTFTIDAANVTLYAKWVVNRYTVTYNGNGAMSGNVPTDGSYDYNTSVAVPGNTGSLVKSGYTFAGWNTEADGSGTGYGAGAMFVMGTSNIALYAQWLNSNALLAGLFVDQGILSPSFSLSNLYYIVDMDNAVSNLNLSLLKENPTQTVSVTGAVYQSVTNAVYSYQVSNLIVGSNLIQIRVNAQDGTTNMYTVTVNRAAELSGNADLSNLALSNGALSPNFAPGTTAYTSSVANGVSSINVTASTQNSKAKITVNGNTVASGKASDAINLNVGNNPVTVVVTAENGTTKTYTIAVNRTSSNNSGESSSTPPTSTSGGIVNLKEGKLTLPAGKPGNVNLKDIVMVSIPAGATDQELILTLEQVLVIQNLLTEKDVPVSPIYEILKSFTENFLKPVTLTIAFDPASLKSNQTPAIFYFDEMNKEWVEVAGGKINGAYITVKVDHFTKFAVFAVEQASDESAKGQPGDIQFSDISGHWAGANIKQAVNGGIVTGYPEGTFKPDATVTRAEFAVMLMNTLKPQGEGAALAFTDTAAIGSWARKAVAQAKQAGIINGYEDGSFRPDAQMTRAEMAVMMANALNQSNEGSISTGFADDQGIPEWAKNAVAAIKKLGIVEGKGTNTFDPNANTTRAETVTVLLKIGVQRSG